MKNDIYNGPNDKGKKVCFTVNYLIQNGIISSDSDTEEYILNDITNKKFQGTEKYIEIYYDVDSLKLKANMPENNDNFTTGCISENTY